MSDNAKAPGAEAPGTGSQTGTKVGAVYYLDSAPQEEWKKDLADIRSAGMDHVIIGDMLSLSEALREDKEYFLHALDLCQSNGLNAFLEVFHAGLMTEQLPFHSLPDELISRRFPAYRISMPRYRDEKGQDGFYYYVTMYGEVLPFFNLLSPTFREQWLLPYLGEVIAHYSSHPALAGYQFSEVLMSPEVVGYSAEDASELRTWLKEKHGTLDRLNSVREEKADSWEEVEPPVLVGRWNPAWNDWNEFRRHQLIQWATQTADFIRAKDPDPSHLLVLKDTRGHLTSHDPLGGYTRQMVKPFDAFIIDSYFEPRQLPTDDAAIQARSDIEMAKDLAPGKEVGWWAWTGFKTHRPYAELGEPAFPDPQDIIRVADAALSAGASRLVYYVFRRPLFPGDVYPVKQAFYYHREELAAIAKFNRQITSRTR